jgi:fluoride exporter
VVVIAVAVFGALGALARYGVDRAVEARSETMFPLSTFVINMTGCFAAGVIVSSLVERHHLPAWVRIGVVMGFLGAYTTYSTFAQETWELGDERHLALAALNVGASVVVGLVLVGLGHVVGRQL